MKDTSVTYEREMIMTYGEDCLTMHKRNRINTLLYQEGLCMVGDYAYRQVTAAKRFGNTEETDARTLTVISIDGEMKAEETTPAVIKGWKNALRAFGFRMDDDSTNEYSIYHDYTTNEFGNSVSFEEVTTETTKTVEQSPQGYYLIYAGDFIGDQEIDREDFRPDGHTLAVVGDEMEGRLTFMRVVLHIGAYSAPTLSFKMWYDADSIEKKDAIEQRLVTDPLPLMGQIQATVERCLTFVGVDTTEPVIDCEFKCLNESKSECAPDIIEMVRAEKQKHL